MSAPRRPISCASIAALILLALVECLSSQTPTARPDAAPSRPPLLPAEVAWSRTFGDARAAADARADDKSIYLALNDGTLVALARETGVTVWTASVTTVWPVILQGEQLYAVSNDALNELDPASGAVKRTSTLPGLVTGPATIAGDLVIIPTAPDLLVAWHARDGREVWRQPFGSKVESGAVVAGSRLVAVTGSDIVALDLASGRPLWKMTLNGRLTPPVVAGGRAFVGSTTREVFAVDLARGSLAWPNAAGWSEVIGVTADSKRVYAVSLDNRVRALSWGNGNQLWGEVLSTRPAFAPQLSGDVLLASGIAPALTAMAPANGSTVGTYTLPPPPTVPARPPLVLDAPEAGQVTMVILTRDGQAVALKRKPEEAVLESTTGEKPESGKQPAAPVTDK